MNVHSIAIAILGTLTMQSVYVTVLFLAVVAISAIKHPRTAQWRAGLWSLVFIRLILPVGLASPFAIGTLMPSRIESGEIMGSSELVIPPEVSDLAVDAGAERVDPVPATLVGFWLAGVALLGIRRTILRRRIIRRAKRSRTVRDHLANRIVERWRNRLGIAREIVLKSGSGDDPPFTAGLLHPIVFLPAELLDSADRRALESTIAHELVHVKRNDDLWLTLVAWVRIAYFFHPVAWVAESRLRQAREEWCDESVLRAGPLSPAEYGGGLLTVIQLRLSRRGAGVVPAMSNTRRNLFMRFRHIAENRTVSRLHLALTRAGIVAVAMVLLPMAPVVATAPVASDGIAVGDQPSPASETLRNPVPNARVSSPWGPAKDPWTGKARDHQGVDLAAPVGTEIVAPASATVLMATSSAPDQEAAGTVIILDHGNGLTTFYSHLESLRVKEGDRVGAGQVIGTIGLTGKTTGPHVHFEVRRDGERIDPATLIDF